MTPTLFAILFPGRTGSSWLISCLNSHPEIDARGEELVGRSSRSQQRWIKRLYGGGSGAAARGFKSKLKDVWDLDGFRALLTEHSVRVITMDRRNKIKLAVSTINARRLKTISGRWNQRQGEEVELPPLELDEAELRRVLADGHRVDEQLGAFADSLDLPRMHPAYEELLAAPEERMRDVQLFLGVPPTSISGDVVKNTDDDLSRAVVNYDDLRSRFRDGPYAEMF